MGITKDSSKKYDKQPGLGTTTSSMAILNIIYIIFSKKYMGRQYFDIIVRLVNGARLG